MHATGMSTLEWRALLPTLVQGNLGTCIDQSHATAASASSSSVKLHVFSIMPELSALSNPGSWNLTSPVFA